MAHVRPTKDMRSLSMNEFAATSTTSSKRSIPTPFLRHPSVVEVMEKKQREGLKNRLKMLHTGVLPSRNAAVSKNLPVIVKAPTARVTLPKTLSRKAHYRSVLTLTEEPQEEPSRLTRRHSFGGLICTYGGKDRTSSDSSVGSKDFKSNNAYTDRLSQNKYKNTNTDNKNKGNPDTKSRAKFQVAKDDSHLGKDSPVVSFLPISKTQSQILTNISTEDGFKRTLNSEAKMNGNYKKHDNVDEVFSPSSTEGDLDENLNIKVQSSKDQRGLKDNADKPDEVNQVNGHQEVTTKTDRIENDIVTTTKTVSQTNSDPPRATEELRMTELHNDGNGETRYSEDKESRSLFSTDLHSEDKEPRSLFSTGHHNEDKEPRSLLSTGLHSEDKEPRSLFSTGHHSEDKEPQSLFPTGLHSEDKEDKEPRSLFSTGLHSEDKEPRSLLSTGLHSEDKEPLPLFSTGHHSEDKEPRSLLSTGLHSEDKEPRSLFPTGLSSEDKEPRSLFSTGLESSLLVDINDSPSETPSHNHDTSHEIRLENSQQHQLAPTTFPDFGDSFPAQTGAYTPFEREEDKKKVGPERPVFHEEHQNAFNDNAILTLTTDGKHDFSDDLKELNKNDEKSKDETDNFWSTFEDSFTGPVKTTSNKSHSELIEIEFQKSPDSGLGSYGFSDDSKETNKSDDKSTNKTDAFWSAFEDSLTGSVQTTSSKSPSDSIEVEVQKHSDAGLGKYDSSNGLKELTKTDNEIEDGSDTFLSAVKESLMGSDETAYNKSRAELIEVEVQKCLDAGFDKLSDDLKELNKNDDKGKDKSDGVWSVVEDSFAGSVETTSSKSRSELIEVEVQKCPDAGLGFCIEGGKGSALGDRPVTVKRVFNAATHRCLKEGDEILTVSSQDTSTLTHIEAWKLFKTLPEGPVKMTIIRRME